ncbi:hypothetical protein GOV07_00905 [Candidatus Woesearchaeota archaeon]|nr:hypothetical protein [Candidatus Woesearchaeota archaeon]
MNKPEIIWRPIEELVFDKPKEAERDITPASLKLITAEITKVERHPKADKLYIEHLDDGSGKERVIVSGLVPYYAEAELVGKRIVLVDNLKPAKLRGVESKGMLLAADDGKGALEVLESDAKPGTPVLIESFEQREEEITIDEFFSIKIEVSENKVLCAGKALSADSKPLTTKKVVNGTVA